MSDIQHFINLHQQNEPLIIGNSWNARSAMTFEKLGFKALATSSAAVAEALGYRDGEEIPFDEYLFIVKRIKASTRLPLSVDMETGFGKTAEEVVANLQRLHEAGVVGINIEDSSIQNGTRKLHDAAWFAKKLSDITSALKAKNIRIFINTRIDTFILRMPDARDESIRRIDIYQQTGADGIFLPCITDIDDIKAVVAATQLPINVMCMPNLPDFKTLRSVGVKRISLADFPYGYAYGELETATQKVLADGNFSAFFPKK